MSDSYRFKKLKSLLLDELATLVCVDNRFYVGRLVLTYILLVILSIALQSVVNTSFYLDELKYLGSPYYDLKSLAKAAVYFLSYGFSIFFLLLGLLQRSRIIWVISIGYILFMQLLDVSTQLITLSGGFTRFQYVLTLNEAGNIENLLVYFSEIQKAIILILVCGILLVVLRKFAKVRVSVWWLILFSPFCFASVLVAKAGVHYIKYESYASPVKVPIIIGEYHWKKKEQPPRVLSAEVAAEKNGTQNILFIIDESISGGFLSINGYRQKTTPDLERLVDSGRITNFGIVNSVANCSATSNLMLRIGLSEHTKNAEKDHINTRIALPTIFQYAKRAGYQTWLIDSQADKNHLQGYLTYDDLNYVDEFFTHGTRTEDIQRDQIALDKIAGIMENRARDKKFIVLVKDGAHWPYLWRIPEDRIFFKPQQASEYEPMVRENKAKIINTYSNLLRHTVNDFLKLYLQKINLKNSITFYTSDHGQAFMEEGAIDNLTHCTTAHDPPSNQAAVPLLVMESAQQKKYIPDADRLYSQHQIFPSLLDEMGYSEAIIEHYGKSLLEGYPKDTQRWFYWSLEGHRSPFDIEQVN